MAPVSEMQLPSDAVPDERRFNGASWLVVALAAFLLAFGFITTIHEMTLPTDGWYPASTSSNSDIRFVFDGTYSGKANNLRAGDVLVAIDGQPFAQVVDRALRLDMRMPAGWHEGGTVHYTVLRDGREVTVNVALHRNAAGELLHPFGGDALIFLVVAITFGVAIVVFALRPRNEAARVLLVLLAFWLGSAWHVYGAYQFFDPAAYWLGDVMNGMRWRIFADAFLVHLILAFPVRQALIARYPRVVIPLIYSLLPASFFLVVAVQPQWSRRFWPTFEVFTIVGALLVVVTLTVSIALAFAQLRDPVARAQMRWVTFGLLLAFTVATTAYELQVLALGVSTPVHVIGVLAVLVFPVSLAVAILRYRLYDIDILINRTLVYGVLTALLSGVYFGGVALLQNIFHPGAGQTSAPAIVLSTLATAALFQPLRSRIQQGIDHQFYRPRYDAARTVAEFGGWMRQQMDLATLTNELEALVEDTMQPQSISLWLNPRLLGESDERARRESHNLAATAWRAYNETGGVRAYGTNRNDDLRLSR